VREKDTVRLYQTLHQLRRDLKLENKLDNPPFWTKERCVSEF
jgi:hypothetical protein